MACADLAQCIICGKAFTPRPYKSNKFCGIPCYRVHQRAGSYKRGPGPTTFRAPCANCGKEVVRQPSRNRRGERSETLFCARACYDAFRARIVASRTKVCARCGVEFPVAGGAEETRRYCSEACWKAERKAEPTNCVNCGCLFTAIKWFPRRKRFASANGVKTCSDVCNLAWRSNNEDRKAKIGRAFTGNKHPNWQGGKSRLNNIANRGAGWPKARKRALRRDGYRCVDCGIDEEACRAKYGRGLDVDHIEPFHNWPNSQQANRLSNLASRCASCHRRAEAKRTMTQMVLPFADSEKRRHKGQRRGERHPRAKLTAGDVLAIRNRLGAGVPGAALAREYRVTTSVISGIKLGKIWRNLR